MLVVVNAAVIGVLVHEAQAPSAATTQTQAPAPALEPHDTAPVDLPEPVPEPALDEHGPDVANLDADLLDALRRAAADARGDGITFHVNSGWRSAEHQERLRREAVAKYGSEAEAARWVASAETSPHVSGDAVDIGPTGAAAWLSAHGAAYGLCQIYANEPWHFELRPGGCPPMYADPTHDPRMQQR